MKGRTCTTGSSRTWLVRLRAKSSSQEAIFRTSSEVFAVLANDPKFKKRSSSGCNKPEASQRKTLSRTTQMALQKRRIPVAASVERFRNAWIHESFAECRVTPFLPDRNIRQNNVELTSVSRGCCSRFDVAALLPNDISF
jgi:hypothetical protein